MIIAGRTEFIAKCPICAVQHVALTANYMTFMSVLRDVGWFCFAGQYYCFRHTEAQARLFWKEVWVEHSSKDR